ncbi:hypothetical protein BDV41DRAFT_553674 [Aspergillus transmontanensis]|uniref:Uncharacterized protein n=1 Tax=Aspergillus transmontanensis TaxID=1034304 RepID=A0A5N6VGY3_9EURO|nr:hypothetical protein BDV41DRAFT_553674 [Aspergillus transmontanensis]
MLKIHVLALTIFPCALTACAPHLGGVHEWRRGIRKTTSKSSLMHSSRDRGFV